MQPIDQCQLSKQLCMCLCLSFPCLMQESMHCMEGLWSSLHACVYTCRFPLHATYIFIYNSVSWMSTAACVSVFLTCRSPCMQCMIGPWGGSLCTHVYTCMVGNFPRSVSCSCMDKLAYKVIHVASFPQGRFGDVLICNLCSTPHKGVSITHYSRQLLCAMFVCCSFIVTWRGVCGGNKFSVVVSSLLDRKSGMSSKVTWSSFLVCWFVMKY